MSNTKFVAFACLSALAIASLLALVAECLKALDILPAGYYQHEAASLLCCIIPAGLAGGLWLGSHLRIR